MKQKYIDYGMSLTNAWSEMLAWRGSDGKKHKKEIRD